MRFTPAPDPAPNDGADGRPRPGTRERRFARHIECEGRDGRHSGSPARGGGLREPEAWHARRTAD